MRGIFISQAVLNKNNGGGQFVNSLIHLLEMAVGEDNLTVISLPSEFDPEIPDIKKKNITHYTADPSGIQKIKNMLDGCPRYVNKEIFDNVMNLIKSGDYDFVFLGFSTYKYMIKRIKKETDLPVFVMYQGIAPNTKKAKLKYATTKDKLKTFLSYEMVLNRERANAMLADCNIVHNQRERNVFMHYYHKEPDLFLPVFIADRFSKNRGENPGYKDFSLLFLGSNFGPNLSGLKWFANNVMPKLSKGVSLYIVGQGMEVLRDDPTYQKENIHVIGEVDKLSPWYYHADLVVEPIFEGDGMKTKTVESMMYGKTILGADEAFCGYEGLNQYLCNTADEFVKQIEYYHEHGVNEVNEDIREIYLDKYSEHAVLKTIVEALNKYVPNNKI
jgi:hypothetical protein